MATSEDNANPIEIQLTQGKVAVIDAADYALVSAYKWNARKHPSIDDLWYALSRMRVNGKWTSILMHRLIIGAPKGIDVDHINCDGLDNRRDNLRLATNAQNHANRRKQAGTTSQFKGVTWHKATCKWAAQIKHNQKNLHLGLFISEHDAAHAYDAAARKHFGEFARLNFPDAA